MGEKVLVSYILIVIMICCGCHSSKVYKVGGSSGWTTTNITPSRYKTWAASIVFQSSSILLLMGMAVFEYNKEFHNVVRVTHDNFNRCNSTAPLSTWASGNDSFTITGPGHFYFICSLPGHCWAGQKVDIRVPGHQKAKHGLSPAPNPLDATIIPPAQRPKSGSSSLSVSLNLYSIIATFALPAIAFLNVNVLVLYPGVEIIF
ncbi:hypothetical protein ACS0TY_024324 [Phlomoides rotata]